MIIRFRHDAIDPPAAASRRHMPPLASFVMSCRCCFAASFFCCCFYRLRQRCRRGSAKRPPAKQRYRAANPNMPTTVQTSRCRWSLTRTIRTLKLCEAKSLQPGDAHQSRRAMLSPLPHNGAHVTRCTRKRCMRRNIAPHPDPPPYFGAGA